MTRTTFDVTALADTALEGEPGSALLFEQGRPPDVLAPISHRCGALAGVTCPATIGAVAARHDVVVALDDVRVEAQLGVAATRGGLAAARVRSGPGGPRTFDQLEGPLIDICLLALGRSTPPCPLTPLDLLDTVFADIVLRYVLAQDLGSSPPTWPELSRLHPLADRQPLSPVELRWRRIEAPPMRWSQIRRRIVSGAPAPDSELTPALARWLDDGALARWLFASYPEPDQLRADVCELLDPETAEAFRAAHRAMGRE